jgi:hypothetical protein
MNGTVRKVKVCLKGCQMGQSFFAIWRRNHLVATLNAHDLAGCRTNQAGNTNVCFGSKADIRD